MQNMIEEWINAFVGFIWGKPMLILLVGGGVFFTLYGKLTPFRYMAHSIKLLTGKVDDGSGHGDLSHRKALAAALSGTLGLGNIAGVALALSAGGPGAVFWMWLTALLGVSTKFYTCTLGVMYRHKDANGNVHGGPMYTVRHGLGPKFKWLAVMFAIAGLMGFVPSFQINQLGAVVQTQLFPGIAWLESSAFSWALGIVLAVFVGMVIWGGLQRVADVAGALVPLMAGSYMVMAIAALALNAERVPGVFQSIFASAFSPDAMFGGLISVIIVGVSRGAFSNEAGIGTEVMAHSAAKTNEPVREGLVASLGPIIDTLIVCSCTALVILVTGVLDQAEGMQGVSLTMAAFKAAFGAPGAWLLAAQVLVLSFTTVFTFWYYGYKCFVYLFGEQAGQYYKYLYLSLVVLGAVLSLDVVFLFLIGAYGLMAVPTMVSALLLAPKVNQAAKTYFASHRYRESHRSQVTNS
ncbi:sodium:alanine symporter family protein [Salinivibrio sp. VYel9]|nr:sodium:alanine symporter family protein [Salinivibrio sp. VYel7]MPX89497.1 sodium:alanine symporter family protein [Salinivibrio sp. VYel1]MPX92363.1 sodium:alanine symporter family protein [Salinivibrio sp. VYel9]MPX97061.1 sodium:alanine symporter family protein [Salinivibrio sp. VYel6]MPX98595.1 sodium:alanine symporter family protein [Salinivibrio sp. VYel4]MPY01704.1 sodium:alanine symporter family protein [Salinivibrio sp. VYel5]MPY04620.1 sodium:alanine symporter family protein [Sal